MSPARLARSALPFWAIAASRLALAGLPPSADETRWVEIRPRLKKARHCGATVGPISISFETTKVTVIGFRLPGLPSSGTTL